MLTSKQKLQHSARDMICYDSFVKMQTLQPLIPWIKDKRIKFQRRYGIPRYRFTWIWSSCMQCSSVYIILLQISQWVLEICTKQQYFVFICSRLAIALTLFIMMLHYILVKVRIYLLIFITIFARSLFRTDWKSKIGIQSTK